ncbi:hypothetical protein CA54_41620 [Symmachiella macrocystis]|uniref:Peptidase S54 rhomboid domain-containing protein n=2 Tax=Symmachiella macrocystis TaxID=2527985 RepID=A0A5C6BA07_9PLAN|nr:hypothetical protein CA54_41620 [Symmachiella macrocystis]
MMVQIVAVGLWLLFQIVSSLGGTETGVAYGAHIGGFLAGVVLAKPFFRSQSQSFGGVETLSPHSHFLTRLVMRWTVGFNGNNV